MNLFSKSAYVWVQDAATRRNQFISFERQFDFSPTESGRVDLHLFADTRFRILVNEVFVAYGPARFVTEFPEYDSYDLTPYLKDGANALRVEVNYYGCLSYQTMADGQPGFIAAGGSADGAIDLATPGDWTARVHAAWAWDAPNFSFAQNPAEICDTQLLAQELADAGCLVPVQILDEAARPWGALKERSAEYPDYTLRYAREVAVAAPVGGGQKVYGVQSFAEGFNRSQAPSERFRAFATWVHAPKAQSLEVGCFWSELGLNGVEVEVDVESLLGNHGTATLSLQAGWNLLTARFEILTEGWAYLLGMPEGSGITLHALPDTGCEHVFAVSDVEDWSPNVPTNTAPSGYSIPEGWALEDGALEPLTPGRVMGWDAPDEALAKRDVPYARFAEVSVIEAEQATWALDFGLEYYGHPVIEVDAPAGSILDVAYDDWQRSDGCVNLYGSNPFTDTADRFILKGGRQSIEVLNPRGGIFMQLTLRVPRGHGAAALKVIDVAVRQRTTIAEAEGSVETGDATFDWAWSRSVNTLIASTDDAYSDCPWRERGSYIGDGVVGLNLDALVVSDLRVARRTFLNFGRAALPCGQLPPCAPAWFDRPHEDFSLLWIQGIRDYWSMTGDTDLIEETWPVLLGIWAAPWDCHASGLWNSDGRNVFIDWGVLVEEREGECNGAMNILRVGIARVSAQMARVIGREAEALAFEADAAKVEAAVMEHLWLEDEGRFAPSLNGRTTALHANIWALCFGIGPQDRILEYLIPRLRNNLKQGLELGQGSGHCELYFLFYLLPALAEAGQVELAEQLIVDHYGFLKEIGNETLSECFCRAHRGVGSCCHTWSSAGGIYAHRYVLGLRQVEPGDIDRWILEPKVTDRFDCVEGVYPHPKGPISVRWERKGDSFVSEISAPDGVSVQVCYQSL